MTEEKNTVSEWNKCAYHISRISRLPHSGEENGDQNSIANANHIRVYYHTADEFLRSVGEARAEARRCESRIEALRSQCEKVTAAYGSAAGSRSGGDGSEHRDALLAELADQTREQCGRLRALLAQIRRVEAFIDALPDERHRAILRLRYVDGLVWREVTAELERCGIFYEQRQIYRLHNAALAEARKRYAA